MREIANRAVAARSCVLFVCAVMVISGLRLAAMQENDLTQAMIAFGFLRRTYVDLDRLLQGGRTLEATHDLLALENALDSLDAEVPQRLGSGYRSLVVPATGPGQWIGTIRTAQMPPDDGTLFVTERLSAATQRIWVIFSSVAPEQTTVFWLERSGRGYKTGLIYDRFKKGDVRGERYTGIGAVTAVRIESENVILLKEWAPPGSRRPIMGEMGRVFRIDLRRAEVTLSPHGGIPKGE